MRRALSHAFFASVVSLALAQAASLAGVERPVPALAELAEIGLGTPTGWWLRIYPDGSAGLGFGSHRPDSASAPARSFRFAEVYKSLAGTVRSDGNIREFLTVAFRRSGEQTTYAHYTDRADVVRALFDAARASCTSPGNRRIEQLWRENPPIPKSKQ